MIRRVFVDTDLLLDAALAREPFLESSKMVLSLLENNAAIGFISSNCVANLYYILRKAGGDEKARLFISKIVEFLTVISIDHSDVILALKSDFTDFEDALQYFSAKRNQCECIITRNLEDYRRSRINVYSPVEFLSLYSG